MNRLHWWPRLCGSLALVILQPLGAPGCHGQFKPREVNRVDTTVPSLEEVDVTDSAQFLNNLKLSPYWKVERDRDGSFIAKARAIGPESDFGNARSSLLFEFMGMDREIGDFQIQNDYLRGGGDFSSFSASVVFREIGEPHTTEAASEQKISLPIMESDDTRIGPNSYSEVMVRLSANHKVFLVVYEQGADTTRVTTWQKLPVIMRHLHELANLPAEYRVVEQYADLHDLLFPEGGEENRIRRFPGLQDRDTFCGVISQREKWNLEGVSVRISHPEYCDGECTRQSARLRKAEYLGRSSGGEGDLLFFLIEDNAVYLKAPYNQRFGTFSGSESFEGTLEILDADGNVIVSKKDQFNGWER